MARRALPEFDHEGDAIGYFEDHGWSINSYHGANGITLHCHSKPGERVFLYRDSTGKWQANHRRFQRA